VPGQQIQIIHGGWPCVFCIVGIWIEKGMGLVIPGFIPPPPGEMVEDSPSLNETLIC
jgi:molybdopterin-containing oxidoreductase family membrane subunit